MTVSPSRNPDVAADRGIPDTVTRLRATFRSGRTKPLEWRRAQLAALLRLLEEREPEFAAALAHDLGRPTVEAWLAHPMPGGGEAQHAMKNGPSWVGATRVKGPPSGQPGEGRDQVQP